MKQKTNWGKYAMEFISIFIAVIAAFALNNWGENSRDHKAATKILTEIGNGLQKDLDDININMYGHEQGIKACKYWRRILDQEEVDYDSLFRYYIGVTRDFFILQNNSGYETLKSKGLELLENDSLRFDIISLYEYDYKALKIMEEEYHAMQFEENYFKDFNAIIAPHLQFNKRGEVVGIDTPIEIDADEKKLLLSYLRKIQFDRAFILRSYKETKQKVQDIAERIAQEIEGG